VTPAIARTHLPDEGKSLPYQAAQKIRAPLIVL
jgi:hypothetical protein